ncbi:MAG: hypothetical protein U1F87_10250 [Kiritimatiellia bacterium]
MFGGHGIYTDRRMFALKRTAAST